MDKNKIQKLLKNKKIIIVMILALIGIICLLMLQNLLSPNGKVSNYGNRLDGIKKVKFDKSDKDNIVTLIKNNEKVSEAKLNVHGKIINIIFNVVKDTPLDESKAIATQSLESISEEIKNFYDIQYIITMNDEVGVTEVKNLENGENKEVEIKNYPIMGYKNSSSTQLVW